MTSLRAATTLGSMSAMFAMFAMSAVPTNSPSIDISAKCEDQLPSTTRTQWFCPVKMLANKFFEMISSSQAAKPFKFIEAGCLI